MMMLNVLDRAKASGLCPPSLLNVEHYVADEVFEEGLGNVMAAQGFALRPEAEVGAMFVNLVENKANSLEAITGATSEGAGKAALTQRRSLLLALVAATPTEAPCLAIILDYDFLSHVKKWMDEALKGTIGSVDFLLHLLSSIVILPVTKAIVKDSGMGKLIGSIGKHSAVKGSANENAITERAERIKDTWSQSVKARKPPKRDLDELTTEQVAKKAKVEEPKKGAFSTLLQKVSKPAIEAADPQEPSAADAVSKKPVKAGPKAQEQAPSNDASDESAAVDNGKQQKVKKNLRVKWADHFGGTLSAARFVDGRDDTEPAKESSLSWSDRKRRDRLREKELLAKAKKAKLLDDDDDDYEIPIPVQSTVAWKHPQLLPVREDVSKADLQSGEVGAQDGRNNTVQHVWYESEYEVPSNPAPLSDVEQALDMTSQSSVVVANMPFFVPAEEPGPAPAPEPAADFSATHVGESSAVSMPVFGTGPASPEFVNALGLPMFLAGQDSQALQTLANSPSLLATLVDANGNYDQPRLMSLVQTLSASSSQAGPAPSQSIGAKSFGSTPSYGQSSSSFNKSRANSAGNLHVSGFGPATSQMDLITLFMPYVKVDEVVMKGTFAFINTSDPANAERAKEALNGSLVGGMPIRVNSATRRGEPSSSAASSSSYGPAATAPSPYAPPVPAPSSYVPAVAAPSPYAPTPAVQYGQPPVPSYGGIAPAPPPPLAYGVPPPPPPPSFGGMSGPPPPPPQQQQPPPQFGSVPAGMQQQQQIDVDAARDDRGNPATKNLFVAGYGPGTTEPQLREVFGHYAQVVGVVLKSKFAFVNTNDRAQAVAARENLGGQMLNGGRLRINFAKETGRLGTSFDLTYNVNTGPNAPHGAPTAVPAAPNNLSYYGRGF